MQEDFSATLGRMINAARQSSTDDESRSTLLDRYNAEPYGDEVEGASQVVAKDIQDVVEALLPDIMDVFTSAEAIVEFSPVGPEDEDAAKQETEVCNNIFWQQNNGYLILYTWIKEALIQQNAYVKSSWQEKTRREFEEYEGLTPDELAGILNNIEGEYEVVDFSGIGENGQPEVIGMDPQTGQPQFAPINISLRITTTEKRYVIECIPNEDIYYTPRWHSLSFDGVPIVGHCKSIERGELIEMGFDEDVFDKAAEEDTDEGSAELARHDTNWHFDGDDDDAGDKSTQKVTVYESYVRMDRDGDGVAELLQVWSINDGKTILTIDGEEAVKEVSGHPFSALTPFIMPHRHVGLSVAELVEDIQRVNTVLMRQTLDNVYRNNNARPSYDENDAGPHLDSDLANPAAGAPVRTGGALIDWQRPPPVIDVTLPIMQQLQDLKEQRTGATRTGEGLNGESLNQHSEQTVGRIMDASMKKRLLIARTFAETGLADLFRRMHRDLRSGPMREMVMRIRNQWVAVNPRTWKHRSDMTVSVGIGSGDRDQKRQGLMLMAQTQEKLMMAGAPIVTMQEVYNVAEKVMETFGFENIQPFLKDPSQIQQQPEQEKPDPQEQMMQAQIQMGQQQLQQQAQKQQQEYDLKREEIQLRHQRELEKLRLDSGKLSLSQQEAIMDDDFKRDKLAVDAQTAHMRKVPGDGHSAPPVNYQQVTNG